MEQIQRGMLKEWNVLVVDDDQKSLDIASSLLQYYGSNVYRATNGMEGWQLAFEFKPDFIVTDLSMPIMDGWTLIRKLKEHRETQHIPIIALTAHAYSGDRTRAIAAGCHNYLNKPLTPYTFVQDLLLLLADIPSFAERLQASASA